jgi:hypothetical protein
MVRVLAPFISIIVSWNFKHLASLHRNERFNAVNVLPGWPAIRIVPRACC